MGLASVILPGSWVIAAVDAAKISPSARPLWVGFASKTDLKEEKWINQINSIPRESLGQRFDSLARNWQLSEPLLGTRG
jgi:hypothetical protein